MSLPNAYIATRVYPDMTEYGWDRDEWPRLFEKVEAAHVVVIGTPIGLGDGTDAERDVGMLATIFLNARHTD